MKLISKEEVKKNHKDILGLDLLFAENFPPYLKYIMYVGICGYVHTKGE